MQIFERLSAFMKEHVYPNEARYSAEIDAAASRWTQPGIMEELKSRAQAQGLWNLFLPEPEYGAGLSNREYAPLCELMGTSRIAPEVFNCNAPDTGNMEVLARYGSPEQRERWLAPLLRGEIRSGFAMTEPDQGSSDATNISASIVRDGDHYIFKRPQVVDDRRNAPAHADPHLYGQDRSESPETLAAVDDSRADS
jgi:acyl-CoA dehydrogenase